MDVDRSRALQLFNERFGARPSILSRAPGRVNVIGEHTDYNEGFVMPLATDLATWVAAAPRADRLVRVYSDRMKAAAEFSLDNLGRCGDWVDYIKGVAWALTEAGVSLRGLDAAIVSSVPPGSGVSSSAALEVSWALAMLGAAEAQLEPKHLALVCQRAENEFVGMNCGVMDQMASVLGSQGHAILLDCRTLEYELVPVPADEVGIVVMDTGVPRALVDSEYNLRRQQCAEAARAMGVPALRDATLEQLERARCKLDEVTYRRARHVITENQRVHQAASAFAARDFERVGNLIDASHFSLRDDYEVSCPELDLICEIARRQEGCYGARLVGAGFGGCAMALVAADAIRSVCMRVKEEYDRATGRNATVFAVRACSGAELVQV
ncbi:MAG: galactokinase [Armatimonadetes bacterium]|nr:galactokinase [Armatimonadota bacterium]